MIPKIKKCFNCHSRPALIRKNIQGSMMYKLRCECCGVEQVGHFTSKRQSILAWNKGANPVWEEVNI